MDFTFRKSIKLPPGLKTNMPKCGTCTSVGGPGATINVRKRGLRSPALALLLAVAACSQSVPPASAPSSVVETTSAFLALGTPVSNGTTSIAVQGNRTRQTVGDPTHRLTAPDGQIYVIVLTLPQNLVEDKAIKDTWLSLRLVDPQGPVDYVESTDAETAYRTEQATADMVSDSSPSSDDYQNAELFEVPATFDPATWYAVTSDGTKLALQ